MHTEKQEFSTVFVIQARMGSVRLPGKILMPAFEGKSILDIITARLQERFPHIPLYIASGPEKDNAALGAWAAGKNIRVTWGSENDVLSRFRTLAEQTGADYLVRICADNPFLDMDYLQELLDAAAEDPADYIAQHVNGTPSIRSHLGLYCELVSGEALRHKMNNLSPENCEHVTSYMYGEGREHFRIHWVEHHWPAEVLHSLRLSVDTPEDMEMTAELFARTEGDIRRVIPYVLEERPDMALKMSEQIEKYKK